MYFNIFQNVYSCDGKAGFSAAILQSRYDPSEINADLAIPVLKTAALFFVETMIFFLDYLWLTTLSSIILYIAFFQFSDYVFTKYIVHMEANKKPTQYLHQNQLRPSKKNPFLQSVYM